MYAPFSSAHEGAATLVEPWRGKIKEDFGEGVAKLLGGGRMVVGIAGSNLSLALSSWEMISATL